MENTKKYYYLYKITNKINNRYYIGAHGTNNLGDEYFGSGRNLRLAIKKYGKDNFRKEILKFYNSYKELMVGEKLLINKETLKDRKIYNSEIGGAGGKIWTKQLKEKVSKSNKGKIPWIKGKKHTREARNKMSKNHVDVSGKNNPMYGIDVSTLITKEANKERIKKISKANKNKKRTEEHKKKYSDYAKKRFWIIHKSGQISHCLSKDDKRLKTTDWKLGKKYKGDF